MNISTKALLALLFGVGPLLANAHDIPNTEPAVISHSIDTGRKTTGITEAGNSPEMADDLARTTRSTEYRGGAAGRSTAGSRAVFTPTSYSPPVYIIR
ncbi:MULTISPECIES: hypothetical protein [Burkholderiaceae]|uniref:hypothetical protein n=1 Tax=Burkholderiaceae TaxID=119060 RepID=UPI0012E0B6D4|nr:MULTISPECIES: hypothetical protein [Burkholderiaceae]